MKNIKPLMQKAVFTAKLTTFVLAALPFALSWGYVAYQLGEYEFPQLFAGERIIYQKEEKTVDRLEAVAAEAKAHLDGYHEKLKELEAMQAKIDETKGEMLQGFLNFE